jgi:hypothetical protein
MRVDLHVAQRGSYRRMFFVIESDERPNGYVVLSEANEWEGWLGRNIPGTLDDEVRRRLRSNLKHLMVGLELKAALIDPHAHRGQDGRPMLFESYFQNLIQEFCVGVFSVLEGLGSAQWLHQNGHDGATAPRIGREAWLPVLCAVYDAAGEHGLNNAVERTLAVRDLLHQDRLGARENIDWHAFSYDAAFVPASSAIRTLLRREPEHIPATTNLI